MCRLCGTHPHSLRCHTTQPAIYVASLAAVEKLRATEGAALLDSVDVTCGLSLGEYTALAFAGEGGAGLLGVLGGFGECGGVPEQGFSLGRGCVARFVVLSFRSSGDWNLGPRISLLLWCQQLSGKAQGRGKLLMAPCHPAAVLCYRVWVTGAMSFEDGLKLVKLRGESMQAAADAAKSGMVSVVGLNKEKVAELCEAATKEVRALCGSQGEESRVEGCQGRKVWGGEPLRGSQGESGLWVSGKEIGR